MEAATISAAVPTPAERELMLALYRRMRLIRRFEEAVHSLFLKGEVHGTTHLYNGEEASATGVGSTLGEGDRVAGTYRGHGHALSLGTSPQGLLDELLGRSTGVCGGRAGSMNVIDLEHGLIGCFGIVGGSISAALGASLALRGTGKVAVAYFGEGATNQAYFHECLNFARVFNLPAVFVCENNLYGEFTPMEQVTAGQIGLRVAGLDIPYQSVDGMDVWATRAAALRATEHARAGNGPVFLEMLTYRFVGHSRSDPGRYRKPGELEQWQQRDPLILGRRRLIDDCGASGEDVDAVDAEIEREMTDVIERALAAPYPDPATPASAYKP
jgi:acetoin:2,6-dichlorophenolindophenol oxidoreductase subunit alpha